VSGAAGLPLVAPGYGHGLFDVFRQRYLLKLIVRKELRIRYRGSVLGMAWSYVKPATQFLVYFLAMGYVLSLRKTVPDYAVYLFCGIVVMNFFGEGFGNATRSLIWNAPLINKIYLPRELFPVASLWVSAVHFLPQLVVLVVAALVSGWRPAPIELLAGLAGFVITALLALGLGLLFGAANVFFRDAENIVDLIVMVATWASPVLYTWGLVKDNVPNWVFWIYQTNPLTVAVELFHYAFWYGGTGRPEILPDRHAPVPDQLWLFTGVAFTLSLILVLVGQAVFRRLEGRFAQEL
jgi:ABC-2 type transport system permease protein